MKKRRNHGTGFKSRVALEAGFCVDALNEAIHRYGASRIMNPDQGSPFTSFG